MSDTTPLLSKASSLSRYGITGIELKKCILSLKESLSSEYLAPTVRAESAKNDTDFLNYCSAIDGLTLDTMCLDTTAAAEKSLATLTQLYNTAFVLYQCAKQHLQDYRSHPSSALFKPRTYLQRKLLVPGAAISFFEDQLKRFDDTLSDTVKRAMKNEYDCPVVTVTEASATTISNSTHHQSRSTP